MKNAWETYYVGISVEGGIILVIHTQLNTRKQLISTLERDDARCPCHVRRILR